MGLDQHTRSTSGPGSDENGSEDWLADVGEVDWDETETAAHDRVGRGAAGGSDAGARPTGPVDAARAAIQRRRTVAALVGAVVLVLAIAIPVIVFGGNDSSSTETPPVTTATTPQTPAAAPPAAPRPTT